jgi:hypothetical protein
MFRVCLFNVLKFIAINIGSFLICINILNGSFLSDAFALCPDEVVDYYTGT